MAVPQSHVNPLLRPPATGRERPDIGCQDYLVACSQAPQLRCNSASNVGCWHIAMVRCGNIPSAIE
jgi:hypothetical protein